jgi:hypothetical protein
VPRRCPVQQVDARREDAFTTRIHTPDDPDLAAWSDRDDVS